MFVCVYERMRICVRVYKRMRVCMSECVFVFVHPYKKSAGITSTKSFYNINKIWKDQRREIINRVFLYEQN